MKLELSKILTSCNLFVNCYHQHVHIIQICIYMKIFEVVDLTSKSKKLYIVKTQQNLSTLEWNV